MNEPSDEMIEALLRGQFDGPVRDDGFSDRVMQRLPRHRRRSTWPLWGGVLLGVGACWLALLDSPLLQIGWRDWLRGDYSAPTVTLLLAILGMAVLALAWGVAETQDR